MIRALSFRLVSVTKGNPTKLGRFYLLLRDSGGLLV